MEMLKISIVGDSLFIPRLCKQISEAGHEIVSIVTNSIDVSRWALESSLNLYKNIQEVSNKSDLIIFPDYFCNLNSNSNMDVEYLLLDHLFDGVTSYSREKQIQNNDDGKHLICFQFSKTDISSTTTLLSMIEVLVARYRGDDELNQSLPQDIILSILESEKEYYFTLVNNRLEYAFTFDHLEAMAQRIKIEPKVNLWSVPILSQTESNLIDSWNNRQESFEFETTITDKFENAVSVFGNRIAIVYKDNRWTYNELSERSLAVALAVLRQFNLSQLPLRIGLALERGFEMVSGMFGVLRSGAMYIPLDYTYPINRLKYIINDTNPNAILIDDGTKNQMDWLPEYAAINNIKLINISTINTIHSEFSLPKIDPHDCAYVIYTSGTTGNPKGVVIKHMSVVNTAMSAARRCNIDEKSSLLSVASIGFDAVGWDVYSALFHGATLVIADEETRMNPDKLIDCLIQNQISMATLTPSVVKHMPKKVVPSLKTLVIMGDSGDEEIFRSWVEKCDVINGYGPTETTIAATLNQYVEGGDINNIGYPLHHYHAHVIDTYGNLVPPGVTGELCISGPCVAVGYLNLPIETEKKFIPCKFNPTNSPYHHIMYKTGDFAEWCADGTIKFRGRRDQQVKILGVRIEIGDIEKALVDYPEINEAIVLIKSHLNDKRLVAFYTSNNLNKVDETLLIGYMRDRLHQSVVPSLFIALSEMPLTINGKIDRKSLEDYPVTFTVEYIAPRDEFELIICNTFANILNLDKVGINDDFFSLGGHSLYAAQISARLNDYFKTNIFKASSLFQYSTPDRLSNYFKKAERITSLIPNILASTNREGPISYAQQRLWYLYQFDSTNCAYNLPIVLRFNGKLDLDAFNQAIAYLIKRHESLRTIILNIHGKGCQKVIDYNYSPLKVIPLLSKTLPEAIHEFSKVPFDIENDVCWRHVLYKAGESEYIYVTVKHNLITDAWSEGLLIREFNYAYTAYHENREPALPALELQQLDYAFYERQHLALENLSEEVSYWKAKLSNYIDTIIPGDFPRESTISDEGYRLQHKFAHICTNKVREFARRNDCTPFMVYLTALKILVSRYTNQLDITIGTATSGRKITATETMTGFFVNTLPLRSIFSQDTNAKQALDAVKKTCMEAYDNQDLPFDWLVDQVGAHRELNKTPIFQIIMILQNANEGFSLSLPSVACEAVAVQTYTTMFDMSWNFVETDGDLSVNIDYSTKLYMHQTIQSLVNHYETILNSILDNPERGIFQLPIFTAQQKESFLSVCYGSNVLNQDDSIIDIIEKVVRKNPDNIAITTMTERLTYFNLYEKVIHLSNFLMSQAEYNNSSKRVAIILDRTCDLIISILAIVRSGGSYIPIDPEYPEDRIKYMLKDSQADYVLTDDTVKKALAESINSEFPAAKTNEVLYTIYTSGSTGLPKGVVVYQASVINIVYDFIRLLSCKSSDRFFSVTTISFDIFVLEYLVPLFCGAELILCDRSITRDPVKLVNYFNELQPTLMQATPTLWDMIVEHLNPDIREFRLITGGESLPHKVHKKLCKIASEVWNVYGPTETTIWSTATNVKDTKTVSIGKPIANTACYIIDDNYSLLPQGAIGELCIGGIGVAKEYWLQPELTNEKFITIDEDNIGRIYKTGDLARLNGNSELEFLGRKDFQVKIRGNRVELSEIETVLSQYQGIQSCVVNLVKDGDDTLLVAYYITADKNLKILQTELHEYLSEKLPTVMLPSAYMALDHFPMTLNRKVDRKKLPIPKKEFGASAGKHVSPTTKVETQVLQIWEKVLKIKNISILDNFFIVGGNSLHIPIIVSELNEFFNMELTLRDFILNSTIQAIAELVNNRAIPVDRRMEA